MKFPVGSASNKYLIRKFKTWRYFLALHKIFKLHCIFSPFPIKNIGQLFYWLKLCRLNRARATIKCLAMITLQMSHSFQALHNIRLIIFNFLQKVEFPPQENNINNLEAMKFLLCVLFLSVVKLFLSRIISEFSCFLSAPKLMVWKIEKNFYAKSKIMESRYSPRFEGNLPSVN